MHSRPSMPAAARCRPPVQGSAAQESLEGYGEVAAFKREHIMHPLPLDRVDGLLLKLGTAVKLPQKVPAATVSCTP